MLYATASRSLLGVYQHAWHAELHAKHQLAAEPQLCAIGAFTCAATLHDLTTMSLCPTKPSQHKISGQCGCFGHHNMFALFCDNRQRRYCSHIQAKPSGYRAPLSDPYPHRQYHTAWQSSGGPVCDDSQWWFITPPAPAASQGPIRVRAYSG